MALCVERFRHSTALIVCLESGIFTQLATLAPHLTTWCRLADGNNVQTLFSCGFLRSKVNVCELCIEVNCLYITIERELSLGEYLKKITLFCIAAVSLRCYSSRLQDQLSPLSFCFLAKQSMFLALRFGMSSLSLLFRQNNSRRSYLRKHLLTFC